nr:flagellar filament capping protein FliD [Zobellella iuensis]
MQLAQAHKLGSAAVAPDKALGSGSLTLQVGSESFSVNIDQDKSSLADVATAINNAEDNKGVRATVITDDNGSRLVYFADKTGTDNQISVTASSNNDGEDGNSLSSLGETYQIQAAQNGRVSIDGAIVTSQSNEIKNAIADVTLNLTALNDPGGSKPTTTLTIGHDKDAVETNLKDFVKSYNKVIGIINQLSRYDAENEKAGPLNGDSTTRSLSSKIRSLLSEPVEGALEPLNSLTALGIKTKQDGTIELNDTLLKKQVSDNFEKVGALFASENGVGNKLSSLIESFIGKDGILTQKDESLNKQMRRVEQDADRFEEYMASFELRVYKQFSAMDMMVAQMNQQLNSMMAAFASMPSMGGNQ